MKSQTITKAITIHLLGTLNVRQIIFQSNRWTNRPTLRSTTTLASEVVLANVFANDLHTKQTWGNTSTVFLATR